MTTDETLADYQHTCTVLEQVLEGLVTAFDALVAADLVRLPTPRVPGTPLALDEPLEWHVFAYQLREARELLERQQGED